MFTNYEERIMAKKCKYHPGDRFNGWTLVSFTNGKWSAKCDCGIEAFVFIDGLTSGRSTRCRKCYGKSQSLKQILEIGPSTYTAEYNIWQSMKSRCNNPNNHAFKRYGGRGISVIHRWLEFKNFLEDMGPRPTDDLSLDRIDVDGNYCPENCRWATRTEQSRNTRKAKNSLFNRSILDVSEESGIPYSTLRFRLRSGWSAERAISTPVRAKKHPVNI